MHEKSHDGLNRVRFEIVPRTVFFVLVGLLGVVRICSGTDEPISFNREIAPILAESCFQCHGPDETHRDSDLRLDQQQSVFSKLKSGKTAITRGEPSQSEILTRLKTDDETLKMPPSGSGYSVSPRDIQIIETWIQQGAHWSGHWAFQPLSRPRLPVIQNRNWPQSSIDYFILARLESHGLNPAPPADAPTLRRRIYTDVVGFIPVGSPRHGSFDQIVDTLLSSPRFGEKWGRHWLDVARYADSNGADENHYYPNAYHYRDWVINSTNADLPFDEFVTQQLAGDLVATIKNPEALAGTGFLAIGIKILAEKDPLKKQMDMIDEQLDTLGQTFLGLTVGCARCHDHKFDPIPTTDYYALAGILYSTEIVDQELYSEMNTARKAIHDRAASNFKSKITESQKQLESLVSNRRMITRQAESFNRGNVVIDKSNYGKGIGIISDPGPQENFAEYEIDVKEGTTFLLQLRYAAEKPRPGRILVNGEVAIDNAIFQTTGSWFPDSQTWFYEGKVRLKSGNNILRFESKPLMSHLDQFRLISLSGEKDPILSCFETMRQLEKQLAVLKSNAPVPRMVMAAKERNPDDIAVHQRGNHLDLGQKVPRGFLSLDDKQKHRVQDKHSSGRLELAKWLTEKNSLASHIVARVMVNRIWQWYFGRGLVDSPNEFGIRGKHPSHPDLLDHLARLLMESNWSTKEIHREILLSSTYQMASVATNRSQEDTDPENRLLSFHSKKRMSPEIFRDSILQLRGDIDLTVGGAPPKVTSQNPSPEQLAMNQSIYDSSRRRSVFLPIVRSNTYDLFTIFDFPDASTTIGKRAETIVPTQALLLMNGMFVQRSAKKILVRLKEQNSITAKEIFRIIIGRPPIQEELDVLNQFLGKQPSEKAIELLIHSLLVSNDFIFVD